MSVLYLVDDELFPNDGSREMIQMLDRKWNCDHKITVYPDVHKKEGALVTNGLLVENPRYIITDMLGVPNCGYTIFKISRNLTLFDLQKINDEVVRHVGTYKAKVNPSKSEITIKLREMYIEKLFDFNYSASYSFLGLERDDAEQFIDSKINKFGWNVIYSSWQCLGAGNHFLEIHQSVGENCNYCLLHTDSIGVGMKALQMYSPLSEIVHKNQFLRILRQIRIFQRKIMFHSHENIKKMFQAITKIDIYKTQKIDFRSELGKDILSDFLFAEIIGFVNRDRIATVVKNALPNNTTIPRETSISHDSTLVAVNEGELFIRQQNGVQIADEDLGFVPSCIGGEALLIKSLEGKSTPEYVNHGVGRVLDKQEIEKLVKKNEIEKNLNKNIIFTKLSSGATAEYHPASFKDLSVVESQIQKYRLAKIVGRTRPRLLVKG
jgi:RNA-splicing ligase RtcB